MSITATYLFSSASMMHVSITVLLATVGKLASYFGI